VVAERALRTVAVPKAREDPRVAVPRAREDPRVAVPKAKAIRTIMVEEVCVHRPLYY